MFNLILRGSNRISRLIVKSAQQKLFDLFKEDMENKYGYDSNATTSEDEIENDIDKTGSNVCNICDFKAKTTGGLKTHVKRKHK